jgi:hypothetical protein
MVVRSYSVTPSLWLGEIPLAGGIPCESVEDAVGVIYSGESAVLPHGYWAEAREVLRALGVGETTVDDRVFFAQLAHF